MMFNAKILAPALLFAAGAVFGRVFGLKPLVRGAMTAASMTGMVPAPAPARSRAQTRKIAHRPARRRAAPKRTRAA
jgi:hypothetical protein